MGRRLEVGVSVWAGGEVCSWKGGRGRSRSRRRREAVLAVLGEQRVNAHFNGQAVRIMHCSRRVGLVGERVRVRGWWIVSCWWRVG